MVTWPSHPPAQYTGHARAWGADRPSSNRDPCGGSSRPPPQIIGAPHPGWAGDSRDRRAHGIIRRRCLSRARALTPAPKDPHPRDSGQHPFWTVWGGPLSRTLSASPHGPDADFEARGQIFGHKLAVTTLIVFCDVLPRETCFWVEGDTAREGLSRAQGPRGPQHTLFGDGVREVPRAAPGALETHPVPPRPQGEAHAMAEKWTEGQPQCATAIGNDGTSALHTQA